MKKTNLYLTLTLVFIADLVAAKNIGEVIKSFTNTFVVSVTKVMLSLAFLFFF
jgi:hypothetical protein